MMPTPDQTPAVIKVALEGDPIRDTLAWAATTVIMWVVIVSVGLLLLRLVERNDRHYDPVPTSEHDGPTHDDVDPEGTRSAP